MFSDELLANGAKALEAAKAANTRIVTVETCTGGLVSGCLTSISGASQVVERGFVLYHSSAKAQSLGVPPSVSEEHGAVSGEVTAALAEGGLENSTAGVCVAVTGYAGPGGGNDRDPVGTCYIAGAAPGKETEVHRHVFPGAREEVRMAAVNEAITLITHMLR